MWPAQADLHAMVHFDLALHTIPSVFDVGPEYLGSLMILVALVLGLGFSILVLLALFLCLIITCMQPVNRPSNATRLAVISASCFLAISAGLSVMSNQRFASGLDQLLNSTAQLHTLTSQARATPLSGATKAPWPQLRQAGMSALQPTPSLCAGG